MLNYETYNKFSSTKWIPIECADMHQNERSFSFEII
jgi:hypothetical protein